MTQISRRAILALAGALPAAAFAPKAFALATGEAENYVSQVIADVVALVDSGKSPAEQAPEFRVIFERYAAMPQITRFVMGAAWRDMSEAQQKAFRDAFLDYIARIYTNLLAEYKGQRVNVTGSRDFGQKGVLVYSVASDQGTAGTPVEWLVSDRGGDGVKLVDLVVEGVSLLQTQRQEFASMLDKRNGDVDRFISDLSSS